MHLVGILLPHINDDARSKSHQICKICLTITLIKYVVSSLCKECSLVYAGSFFVKIIPKIVCSPLLSPIYNYKALFVVNTFVRNLWLTLLSREFKGDFSKVSGFTLFFTFIYNKTFYFIGLGNKRRYFTDPRHPISLRCNFLLKILHMVYFCLKREPKAVISVSCDFIYCSVYNYL